MSELVSKNKQQNGSRRRDGLYTTGDMARLSQSTLRTVRFYEEAGILRPVQRTEGGHRLFPASELTRLQLVTDLRAAGFSLDEIREMLDAKAHAKTGADAARDVLARIDAQIGSMRERVALLSRLVGQLEEAKQTLAACANCVKNEHFPNDCAHCEVMAEPEEVPAAVSVIWGVTR